MQFETHAPYFEWTAEQAAALESLRAFLAGPPGVFVLAGYAGTGKTTLVVEALRTQPDRIVFTAPTHKAVGVLSGRGTIYGADYATIHRLLGCRRQRANGDTQYLPDFDRAAWPSCDIIVADEISMVGETMWGWLMDAQATWPRHLICMGDPAQLPPVKDGDLSPAFKQTGAQLTEVMRSAGIVLEAAHHIRKNLDALQPVDVRCGEDELGTVERRDRATFLDYATCDFRMGRDAKVLAWTNDAVNWLNAEMRRRLFGDDVPDAPQPDERLVVVKTWSSRDETVMLHAEDEVIVRETWPVEIEGIPAWRINAGLDVDLICVRPEGASALKKALSNARFQARKTGNWKPFYQLQDTFTELRPGYATTVHKSQGSTYENCYVVDRNLKGCHDHRTRNMLRYVAFSRASKRLVIG